MVDGEEGAQPARWLDKRIRGAHVEFGGRRHGKPWNDLPIKEAQPRPLAPSSLNPPHLTLSCQ